MLSVAMMLPLSALAATEVVYLKNGSVIKGTIVEQVPGESLKIQTRDGNVGVRFAAVKTTGFNVGLGYTVQKFSYDIGWDEGSSNCGGVSIKIGLDF
jgi:hypothetical protein